MKNEDFNDFEKEVKYDIIKLEDTYKEDSKKKEIIDNLAKELEKVFNKTKEKVKDVKDSEETKEFLSKAKEQIEKIIESSKKALHDFKEDDRVQDVINKTSQKFDELVKTISSNDTVKDISAKLSDFYHSENVQNTIDKAKDVTIDVTQKVADGVKDLLGKKGK